MKQTEILTHVAHVNGWETAVYMSYMSQNFRLFHAGIEFIPSKLSIFFCSCIRGRWRQSLLPVLLRRGRRRTADLHGTPSSWMGWRWGAGLADLRGEVIFCGDGRRCYSRGCFWSETREKSRSEANKRNTVCCWRQRTVACTNYRWL